MSEENVEFTNDKDSEHFDVLIVGAGLSGVAAGVYLNKNCPGENFLILEAEESYGGTWWTHRSPGIRSDSDLHTFGYSFKPWVGPPIATASEILAYMGEVIKENHLEKSIRYKHRILRANWFNAEKQWFVEAECLENKERKHFRVNFLWMCQGYYRHNEGFTPNWDGVSDFKGRIVHPENWPEDLDYRDKKVVVIGSGATAATVVPAMASSAKHVTMLQRTPTFFRTGRNAIEIAGTNLLHSLSYPITGHYGVSHGRALGYLLPRVSKVMDNEVVERAIDILGDINIELDVDIDLVIDEALKYNKIYEVDIFIDRKTLQEVLK